MTSVPVKMPSVKEDALQLQAPTLTELVALAVWLAAFVNWEELAKVTTAVD
jgi:hypothetical protein